jgi:putative tryptophan/tyrosine transport system substrate-binding protein
MKTRVALLFAIVAVVVAPSVAYSQQPKPVYRVGMFLQGSAETTTEGVSAFRKELRDLGYVEGQNLSIEYRYYHPPGPDAALTEIARELVQSKVDVLTAMSTPEIRALMQATTTIPIVMIVPGDPVGAGLIESLARPGGNVTGLTIQMTELNGKRLELLREVVPKISRVGVLFNPANPVGRSNVTQLEAAGRALGITIHPVEAREPHDLPKAFSLVTEARDQALIVVVDPLTWINRVAVLELVARTRLPSMFYIREFVELGGLMSYGSSTTDHFRRAATYVAKILKGAKPADLPVQQPIKFELFVNLKTAKAIGITISESMLLRADKVIR